MINVLEDQKEAKNEFITETSIQKSETTTPPRAKSPSPLRMLLQGKKPKDEMFHSNAIQLQN